MIAASVPASRPSERVSTRQLIDKLGVRSGARVAIVGLGDAGLADPGLRGLLAERTTDVTEGEPRADSDVVFLGAESVDDLGLLPHLRGRLRPAGAIWVVSRKGKAATLRDVDVIAAAMAGGLVDNKVVSFSETHTALRLVIPRALRPGAADRMRFAALVLAAGAGSRFGGGKLLARLEDRPILQHVLDVVADVEPAMTVVVLGADAEELERAIDWRGELRVRNPDPARGMASSLQISAAKVGAADAAGAIDALLIVLGDQPRLRASVIRALLEAGDALARPVVVPRYAGGGGGNPVLVRRDAWPLIAEARGDRGLGPILAERLDLVLEVPVEGANPDVDRPEDLEALRGPG